MGGNLLSDTQRMALLVIREEMIEIWWERTDIQFQRVRRFVECCCVVLGFVSYLLSVWNRCLSTALQKLTQSEGSPRPQRFLCPSRPGLEPETSRTATARSSHSATGAPYTYLLFIFYTVTSSRHHEVGAHHTKKRATVIEKQRLKKEKKNRKSLLYGL